MSKHENIDDSLGEDFSMLPAQEQIRRFNEKYAVERNLGGWGEEMANCSRIIESLIQTDSLTEETLGAVFERAHKGIPTGAIYLLAYGAIKESIESGKFSGRTLEVVEKSVMADKDPLWEGVGMQEDRNRYIMQQLLTNDHLFELMLPYIS